MYKKHKLDRNAYTSSLQKFLNTANTGKKYGITLQMLLPSQK